MVGRLLCHNLGLPYHLVPCASLGQDAMGSVLDAVLPCLTPVWLVYGVWSVLVSSSSGCHLLGGRVRDAQEDRGARLGAAGQAGAAAGGWTDAIPCRLTHHGAWRRGGEVALLLLLLVGTHPWCFSLARVGDGVNAT